MTDSSFVTVPAAAKNGADWDELTSASATRPDPGQLRRRWWPGWPIPVDLLQAASQTQQPSTKPPEQPAGRTGPTPEPPGRLAAKAEPDSATDGNHAEAATASRPDLPDKVLDPTAFNQAAEAHALRIMANLVDKPTAYVAGYLAFELNISPATARRYIEKFTIHPAAPFYVERGVLKRR